MGADWVPTPGAQPKRPWTQDLNDLHETLTADISDLQTTLTAEIEQERARDWIAKHNVAKAFTLPRALVGTNASVGSGVLLASRLTTLEDFTATKVRFRLSTVPTTWGDFRVAVLAAGPSGLATVLSQTANLNTTAAGAIGPFDLLTPVNVVRDPGVPLWIGFRGNFTAGSLALACGNGVSGAVGALDDSDDGLPLVWGNANVAVGALVGPYQLARGVSAGSAFWFDLLP